MRAISIRRLILFAKVGSINGLEALRVSVKCTLYAGSEPHATSNKIAVPIELHSAVRGKYLPEIPLLMATEAIYIGQQLGESTYLKCHY